MSVVDSIDNDLSRIGLKIIRDIRDVNGYKRSIKDYMKSIRDHEYVIMMISNDFLKSISCMYEVLEILKEKNYREKILQIIIDVDIFSPTGRLFYINFWSQQYKTLQEKAKDIEIKNLISIANDLKQLDETCSNIGEFLSFLSEEKAITYNDLKESNYRQILDYIGFSEIDLFEKLQKIINEKNIENQDIAIDEFISEHSQNSLGYFYKAAIEFKRGQYKKSIRDYSESIKYKPDDALAYNNRANSFYENNQKEKSMEDYNTAISIDPELTQAIYNRALLYKENGYNDEALSDFNRVIELDPFDTYAYFFRGTLVKLKMNLTKQDIINAINDFNFAIELNPALTEAYTNRGNSYFLIENFEQAIDDLSKALELDPLDAENHCNLADVYCAKGSNHNFDIAIGYYSKAIDLNPNYVNPYFNRGNTYQKIESFDKAILDYDKAIELNPNLAVAYLNRGVAYKNIGKRNRSEMDFKMYNKLVK